MKEIPAQDSAICRHEGETSNYCTRCWARINGQDSPPFGFIGIRTDPDVTLTAIREVAERTLQLGIRRVRNGYYELRAGDEVAATFRFLRKHGSAARAESTDGRWTFEKAGPFRMRKDVVVRVPGPKAEVAVFEWRPLFSPCSRSWSAKLHDLKVALRHQVHLRGEPFVDGTLRGPDGRCYRWVRTSGPFGSAAETVFANEAGTPLIHFATTVTIEASAVSLSDLPLLMLVGGYLTALDSHEREASAGGA